MGIKTLSHLSRYRQIYQHRPEFPGPNIIKTRSIFQHSWSGVKCQDTRVDKCKHNNGKPGPSEWCIRSMFENNISACHLRGRGFDSQSDPHLM
jgi:hypothetical protein